MVPDVVGLKNRDRILGDRGDNRADVDLLHAELAHAERLAGQLIEHAVGALDLAGNVQHGR